MGYQARTTPISRVRGRARTLCDYARRGGPYGFLSRQTKDSRSRHRPISTCRSSGEGGERAALYAGLFFCRSETLRSAFARLAKTAKRSFVLLMRRVRTLGSPFKTRYNS